jgi:hypothetical protein
MGLVRALPKIRNGCKELAVAATETETSAGTDYFVISMQVCDIKWCLKKSWKAQGFGSIGGRITHH